MMPSTATRASREDILEGRLRLGADVQRDASSCATSTGSRSPLRETASQPVRRGIIAGFRKMSYYIHDDYDEFVIPYLGQQKIVSDPAAPQSARRTRENFPSARIGAVPKVSAVWLK